MNGDVRSKQYSTVQCRMYDVPTSLPSLNDEMTDMNDGGRQKKKKQSGKAGSYRNSEPASGRLTVTPRPKTKPATASDNHKRQPAFQHPGSRSSIIRLPLLRQSHSATMAVESVGVKTKTHHGCHAVPLNSLPPLSAVRCPFRCRCLCTSSSSVTCHPVSLWMDNQILSCAHQVVHPNASTIWKVPYRTQSLDCAASE